MPVLAGEYEYAALDLLKKKPEGVGVRMVVVYRSSADQAAAPA
jgi:hypothetical protein